eukprot:gnl/MRDRNA2_/MRDRNA2_85750_c0_seq4.p2 gnl/MRDRNA2_/MRDRNA2_85750_c0~~gnl/MRDRNA2_/MRDRNA2_85750_c0_seq4.p2  ORF type:complete len:510 (-),score=94.01 gnl/MRDRNA2_/MRDRNA2_85750_c0_seq4:2164-3693(-)
MQKLAMYVVFACTVQGTSQRAAAKPQLSTLRMLQKQSERNAARPRRLQQQMPGNPPASSAMQPPAQDKAVVVRAAMLIVHALLLSLRAGLAIARVSFGIATSCIGWLLSWILPWLLALPLLALVLQFAAPPWIAAAARKAMYAALLQFVALAKWGMMEAIRQSMNWVRRRLGLPENTKRRARPQMKPTTLMGKAAGFFAGASAFMGAGEEEPEWAPWATAEEEGRGRTGMSETTRPQTGAGAVWQWAKEAVGTATGVVPATQQPPPNQRRSFGGPPRASFSDHAFPTRRGAAPEAMGQDARGTQARGLEPLKLPGSGAMAASTAAAASKAVDVSKAAAARTAAAASSVARWGTDLLSEAVGSVTGGRQGAQDGNTQRPTSDPFSAPPYAGRQPMGVPAAERLYHPPPMPPPMPPPPSFGGDMGRQRPMYQPDQHFQAWTPPPGRFGDPFVAYTTPPPMRTSPLPMFGNQRDPFESWTPAPTMSHTPGGAWTQVRWIIQLKKFSRKEKLA